MKLSSDQIKQYRAIAHNLKPVIIVGENGASEALLAELTRALNDHELIKIKINLGEKSDRALLTEEILAASGASLIQTIGKMAVLYKKAAKPNPKLSNILRQIR